MERFGTQSKIELALVVSDKFIQSQAKLDKVEEFHNFSEHIFYTNTLVK